MSTTTKSRAILTKCHPVSNGNGSSVPRPATGFSVVDLTQISFATEPKLLGCIYRDIAFGLTGANYIARDQTSEDDVSVDNYVSVKLVPGRNIGSASDPVLEQTNDDITNVFTALQKYCLSWHITTVSAVTWPAGAVGVPGVASLIQNYLSCRVVIVGAYIDKTGFYTVVETSNPALASLILRNLNSEILAPLCRCDVPLPSCNPQEDALQSQCVCFGPVIPVVLENPAEGFVTYSVTQFLYKATPQVAGNIFRDIAALNSAGQKSPISTNISAYSQRSSLADPSLVTVRLVPGQSPLNGGQTPTDITNVTNVLNSYHVAFTSYTVSEVKTNVESAVDEALLQVLLWCNVSINAVYQDEYGLVVIDSSSPDAANVVLNDAATQTLCDQDCVVQCGSNNPCPPTTMSAKDKVAALKTKAVKLQAEVNSKPEAKSIAKSKESVKRQVVHKVAPRAVSQCKSCQGKQ